MRLQQILPFWLFAQSILAIPMPQESPQAAPAIPANIPTKIIGHPPGPNSVGSGAAPVGDPKNVASGALQPLLDTHRARDLKIREPQGEPCFNGTGNCGNSDGSVPVQSSNGAGGLAPPPDFQNCFLVPICNSGIAARGLPAQIRDNDLETLKERRDIAHAESLLSILMSRAPELEGYEQHAKVSRDFLKYLDGVEETIKEWKRTARAKRADSAWARGLIFGTPKRTRA